MKKRLIGALLLGALMVSSSSVFTSCKDYDDDINNVSSRVTVLEQAKVDLEKKIADLRADLQNNYATKAALAAAEKTAADATAAEKARAEEAEKTEFNRATAAEKALETRIKTAEDAITALDQLIGGKLDGEFEGMTYKQALAHTWAKMESVEKNLGDRLTKLEKDLNLEDPESALRVYLKNLEDQLATLNAFKKALDEDGGAASKNYVDAQDAKTLADAKADAKAKADAALKAAKEYSDSNLELAKADATAKADAALKAAKEYSDSNLELAKADATAKANAAETNAKKAAAEYTDKAIAALRAELNAEILKTKEALQKELDDSIADVRKDMKVIEDDLNKLSDRIDGMQSQLNVLTVTVRQLKGLVFKPEGYIDGVEALEVFSMQYSRYNNFDGANWIANVNWNKMEKSAAIDAYNEVYFDNSETDKDRNEDHVRYAKQDGLYRVLDFTAQYHLNPSSANLAPITKADVTPIVDNKWFDVTRANEVGMYVDGIIKPTDEGGIPGLFQVKYKMSNPNKAKTDDQITVFATQVKYHNGDADTTITSDYATFRVKYIDGLALAHAPKEIAPSFRDVRNTHCGQNQVTDDDGFDRSNLLLFATITEAAGKGADVKDVSTGFDAQDSVEYTSAGLELEKLVETYYRDVNADEHLVMKDINKYGLHYNFELTYLRYGGNQTSESAHAVIDVKDGKHYLIPWLPTNEGRTGVQSPYSSEKYDTDKAKYQTKQLIGRTPLVRVSLVDGDGNVLDYGYIRIKITDTVAPAPGTDRRFVEYNAGGYSYNIPWTVQNGCGEYDNPNFEFTNTWIETELDIYALAGVSHDEFMAGWEPEYAVGTSGALKQYGVKSRNAEAKTAQFYALPATGENILGTVSELPNALSPETNVLRWMVTADEMEAEFMTAFVASPATEKTYNRSIAVRYKSKDGNEAKDIYVVFNSGNVKITKAPAVTATLDWTGRKNPNYWYATDSHVERSGLAEVHANVYGVEDEKESQTSELQQTIVAAFMGNKIVDLGDVNDVKKFVKLANAGASDYESLELGLEFVLGAQKVAKGIDENGKEWNFVQKISDDGMTLLVFQDKNKNNRQEDGEEEQKVAKLSYTDAANQDINHMRVDYLNTPDNKFAKAILNYRAHNALNNDVLTAYVGVKAKIGTCDVPVAGDPINIRFLRPINVSSKSSKVDDASVNGKQVIFLRDIIALSDWRDQAFKPNYWFYYGVTDIQIPGVGEGQNLATNSDVKTNMSLAPDAEPTKPLSEVSSLVELTYDPTSWTPDVAGPAEDAFGTLTYMNLGSTVQDFTLRLPVKVIYIWGEVFTTVDVKVHHTAGNARK